jgi:hypothetical protein
MGAWVVGSMGGSLSESMGGRLSGEVARAGRILSRNRHQVGQHRGQPPGERGIYQAGEVELNRGRWPVDEPTLSLQTPHRPAQPRLGADVFEQVVVVETVEGSNQALHLVWDPMQRAAAIVFADLKVGG